jgi:hypothetical protein
LKVNADTLCPGSLPCKRAGSALYYGEECTVIEIHLDEKDDPIDIYLDKVFKALFTRNTPESQGALSKLLSAI